MGNKVVAGKRESLRELFFFSVFSSEPLQWVQSLGFILEKRDETDLESTMKPFDVRVVEAASVFNI